MAHFAEIDQNNIVKRVVVVDNSLEQRGADFLANDLALGGNWIQTSYNHNFRKQFAGIGFYYNPIKDIFVAPQPFPSWTLDDNDDWQPPKQRPEGLFWEWDEQEGDWINGETM